MKKSKVLPAVFLGAAIMVATPAYADGYQEKRYYELQENMKRMEVRLRNVVCSENWEHIERFDELYRELEHAKHALIKEKGPASKEYYRGRPYHGFSKQLKHLCEK